MELRFLIRVFATPLWAKSKSHTSLPRYGLADEYGVRHATYSAFRTRFKTGTVAVCS